MTHKATEKLITLELIMTYEVDEKGVKRWKLNGKLHREEGPAVECPDGTQYWYLNGVLHREGGPAIERPNGTRVWYLNGKLHREGGPAVERPDGRQEWWVNGVRHREAMRTCPHYRAIKGQTGHH